MTRSLVLVLGTLAFAVPAAAGPGAPVPDLPAGWSHAEINVTQNGQSHTLIYDRGRIESATQSAIGLREVDGSLVSIPIDGNTHIVGPTGRVRPAALRPGPSAVALRVNGGSAQMIRIGRLR